MRRAQYDRVRFWPPQRHPPIQLRSWVPPPPPAPRERCVLCMSNSWCVCMKHCTDLMRGSYRSRIRNAEGSWWNWVDGLRRSKKTNMFSVLPLWKKGRRRRVFFFFKMAAGHIFQNNRPAYFFKMAARHTWQFSQQMEKLMRESKNKKCDLSK